MVFGCVIGHLICAVNRVIACELWDLFSLDGVWSQDKSDPVVLIRKDGFFAMMDGYLLESMFLLGVVVCIFGSGSCFVVCAIDTSLVVNRLCSALLIKCCRLAVVVNF